MQSASSDFVHLARPYLLVSFLPYYEDEAGAVWLDPSWHHDLIEHLSYLKDFTLCAPRLRKGAEPNLVRFEPPAGSRMRIVPLPPQTSLSRAVRALPKTVGALWRAVGSAEVVHSSVIGWPFPLGWITNPVAVLRRKRLLVIVEAPWLRSGPDGTSWKLKLLDVASEAMARWSCNHADVAIFSHTAYRDTLFTHGRGAAYVTPAVWVNQADILDPASAQISWTRKLTEPIRLLFAGRLVAAKGIEVLLSALRMLDARGVGASVDVVGVGERRDACLQTRASLGSVRLDVLDPVPYGAPFLRLVDRYHALLIPSLSDEQPRVLFDANARAVPAIASNTDGLRPHIEHGKTGWLVPTGDPQSLAAAIEHASVSAPELSTMGMAALDAARAFTHRAMHRSRSAILQKHFA